MKAWIIEWNWIGEYANPHRKFVTIVSARTGHIEIQRMLEFLYSIEHYLPADKIEMARYTKPRENPYPAKRIDTRREVFQCGDNPWLEAFKGRNIRIVKDESGDDSLIYDRAD